MGTIKESQGNPLMDERCTNGKDDGMQTTDHEKPMLPRKGNENDRKNEDKIDNSPNDGCELPSFKKKIFSTIAVFGISSALTLEIGILGPTLNDMQTRTSSSTNAISFLFTFRSITSLIACLVLGPLFDSVDGLFLMGMSSIFGSFFLGSAAWFKNLYLFLGFMAPTGIYSSLIAIGGMLVCGMMWKKHSHAVYQALNLTISASIAMGPILSSGFVLEKNNSLEDISPVYIKHYEHSNNSERSHTNPPLIVVEEFKNISAPIPDDIRVQYVYTITACYLFAWSIFTLVVFCVFYGKIQKPSYKQKATLKIHVVKKSRKYDILSHGLFYVMLCFYAGLEVCYPGYLLTFAVTSLGWTKANGIYVTLLYQVANILATFLCMFLSTRIRPEKILIIDIIICVLSMSLLSVLAKTYEYSLWIFTCTLGVGYGTIVPCSFAWAESKNLAGGKFGAIYWTGYYTGGLIIPPLLGYLFVNIDEMCYVYIMLGCSIGMLICQILLTALFKVHSKGTHKCCEEIEL